MRPLIKMILILGGIFLSTFIFIKAFGLLSIEDVEAWFLSIHEISPLWIGVSITLLLFADLFIAVPTLSLCILSGYFLGFLPGASFALLGIFCAGVIGYWLSFCFGEKLLTFILRDEKEGRDLTETFQRHGFTMILLSRALPILPEVSACLAGMSRMRFAAFVAAWLLGSVPYVVIAAYSGSVSSVEDPKPAIFTAIVLSGFFSIAWYLFSRRIKRNR